MNVRTAVLMSSGIGFGAGALFTSLGIGSLAAWVLVVVTALVKVYLWHAWSTVRARKQAWDAVLKPDRFKTTPRVVRSAQLSR